MVWNKIRLETLFRHFAQSDLDLWRLLKAVQGDVGSYLKIRMSYYLYTYIHILKLSFESK